MCLYIYIDIIHITDTKEHLLIKTPDKTKSRE